MFKKMRKFGTNVSKNIPRFARPKIRLGRKEELNLDDADLRVIKVLTSNPRASLREIASTTSSSVGTVRDRLSKLHRHGVIKGYRTLIDPRKLGYSITAIIKIFEKKEDVGFIESRLRRMPNVFALYSVTGDTDAVVLARFRDSQELHGFVKTLLKMPNVVRTETLLVLDTYKEEPGVFF